MLEHPCPGKIHDVKTILHSHMNNSAKAADVICSAVFGCTAPQFVLAFPNQHPQVSTPRNSSGSSVGTKISITSWGTTGSVSQMTTTNLKLKRECDSLWWHRHLFGSTRPLFRQCFNSYADECKYAAGDQIRTAQHLHNIGANRTRHTNDTLFSICLESINDTAQ